MQESELQKMIREAAETKQEELGEKILDTQIKIITASYDKAVAYSNVIIVAGYASFFGLWTLTKPYLSKNHALWAALLMLASATTFVIFEVYKMAWTGHHLNKRYMTFLSELKGKPPQEILKHLQELEAEGKKAVVRFLPIWRICLLLAALTAAAAIGTLGYALVYALLTGSA